MQPSIFTANQWTVITFWYTVLMTIGGGLLLLSIVKSGYAYMGSALNPGIRVSFIEDTQRSAFAMLLMVLAPFFVSLLCSINDGFVYLFGQLLNHFASTPPANQTTLDLAIGMFEKIIAAPFNIIIKIFGLFGLQDLDHLVFNGSTKIFGSSLMQSINTGNPLADVVVNGGITAFTVYFNAVYTIRHWVVTANLVATPIIVWVWVITAERQVIDIWIGEIIQTIFLQASHAMALGIFTSIATFTGQVTGKVDTSWLSNGLVQIGVFFAGFAGSVAFTLVVIMGIRLIVSRNDKERMAAKEALVKIFIALMILGMCVVIASFLAGLLSGNWGVKF